MKNISKQNWNYERFYWRNNKKIKIKKLVPAVTRTS